MKDPAFSYARLNRALKRREQEAARDAEAAVADLRKAEDIFGRYGFTVALLFGSHAAGRPRADSDIDLLVHGLDEALFFHLKSDLEDRLGRDVDLHTVSERVGFVQRAERTGITVYEAK
jgi:predicted nucleotidyltransferase